MTPPMKTRHRRISFTFDAVATSNDLPAAAAAAWRNISPKVVQLNDTLPQHPENPIFLNFLEGASIWGNYKAGTCEACNHLGRERLPVRKTLMQNIHLLEVKNSNHTPTNITCENWDLDETFSLSLRRFKKDQQLFSF